MSRGAGTPRGDPSLAGTGTPAPAPPRTPPRTPTPGPATAAAALVAVVVAGSGSDAGSGVSFVAGDGAITYLAEQDRREPVALTGNTLDGADLDTATYRGRIVVVNVWASWCSPCRAEAPDLQQAYQRLHEEQVVFVGINTRDDDPAQARAFQRNFGITYPSIVDSGGTVLLALRGAASPKSVPTTLVLDTRGRVAARVNGRITETTLVDLVHDVRDGHIPRGPA
ncbi:MAG: TlpA disulfide reductase family protein [Kineosporiaceae bacterium]